MKNKLLVICASFLLLIFLVFGTYAWYLFFLRASGDLSTNSNLGTKQNDIVFVDKGINVYETDANSIPDEEADKIVPYKFQVINYKKKDGSYILYLEDLALNAIEDGCTEDTLLKRDQLKYQLKLNGKVIEEDYLSKIKDNILDKRDIKANETNEYELRIYIHDGAIDWTGKHYHYKVTLDK